MTDSFKDHAAQNDWVLLRKVRHLGRYGWVHGERAHFFIHGHPLILFDVTGRDGVNNDFAADVLDAGLVARATHIRNFDELFRLVTTR